MDILHTATLLNIYQHLNINKLLNFILIFIK